MREVKTRAAVEQPKMREKSAMPRAAVRILQRRYAQEKRERKPEEYATEQVQQGAADAAQMAASVHRAPQKMPPTTSTGPKRCGSGRRQRRRRCASGICGGQRSRPPRRSTLPQCRANRHKNRLRLL